MLSNLSRSFRAAAVTTFALAALLCVAPAHALPGSTLTLNVQNTTITTGTSSTTLTTKVSYSASTPTGSLVMNINGGTGVGASCYIQSPGLAVCNSTFATGSQAAGPATINAIYTPGANDQYSTTTSTGTLTVGPASSITLTPTNQSISNGTPTTTLAVTGTFNGPSPSGLVSIKVDTGTSVTANCQITSNTTGNCTAPYSTGTLSTGTHTITATIAGDGRYNTTSGTGTLTITGAGPSNSVTIMVAPSSATQGTTANLSASVTWSIANTYPASYGFLVDGVPAASTVCNVTSSTTASCTGTMSTSGYAKPSSHTITFFTNADSNYPASNGTNTLSVN